jgi:hypothetical protein
MGAVHVVAAFTATGTPRTVMVFDGHVPSTPVISLREQGRYQAGPFDPNLNGRLTG